MLALLLEGGHSIEGGLYGAGMDGNGRMGRFLMNAMLASGGYPWTVIPLQRRDDYMAALESASVKQDIRPYAAFVGELVQGRLRGQAAPAVPRAQS